eukprot:3939423-Rhodomonas_salina.1
MAARGLSGLIVIIPRYYCYGYNTHATVLIPLGSYLYLRLVLFSRCSAMALGCSNVTRTASCTPCA